METEDQDSKNLNKILDFVRSQNNGLEANSDDEVENRSPFDYSNISSLPEGEDSPSNFFNLLSKALPIDQINKMLQQELERRRKALSSYLVKCNEAEYLLPKLTAQQISMTAKLRVITGDIKINSEKLEQVNIVLNGYETEQSSLDREIEKARTNVKQLKMKVECCDRIQDCVQKMCSNEIDLRKATSLVDNQVNYNTMEYIHAEATIKSPLVESSITTENTSFVASLSPAKSHTSEHVQLHSTSSDYVSIKHDISLSEGEIIDDSECGSVSESSSETDEI